MEIVVVLVVVVVGIAVVIVIVTVVVAIVVYVVVVVTSKVLSAIGGVDRVSYCHLLWQVELVFEYSHGNE